MRDRIEMQTLRNRSGCPLRSDAGAGASGADGGEIRNLVCTRDHVEAGILFEGSTSGLADIFASLDDKEGK